jgi:hypothetical protein
MRRTKFALIVMLSVGTLLGILGAARSLGQADDDYLIISQLTTMKQRKDFFQTLTPERKSALWRKHYRSELAKHPELTAEQKAVVDLAIVMASTDMFRDNLPEPCGPGSVFRTAGENAFRDTPALRREIFGQPSEPLPKFAHAKKSLDDGLPDCECNLQSWCNACGTTLCGRLGCKRQETGCGCFWQSACDTLCSPIW